MPSNISVLLCFVLLTSWSRVLEQLTVNRLVKQFLTLDLTMFPRVRCHLKNHALALRTINSVYTVTQ